MCSSNAYVASGGLLYHLLGRVDSEHYSERKISYPKLECQNEPDEPLKRNPRTLKQIPRLSSMKDLSSFEVRASEALFWQSPLNFQLGANWNASQTQKTERTKSIYRTCHAEKGYEKIMRTGPKVRLKPETIPIHWGWQKAPVERYQCSKWR